MRTTRILAMFLALSTMVLSGSAQASGGAVSPRSDAQAEHAVVRAPSTIAKTTSTEDVARYAARESKAQNLEKFRGGDGVSIYIGGGAIGVVLIVLLLIIIL